MGMLKNSNIAWIGEIPESWEIDRVKHHFVRQNEKAHQDNPTILSLARSGVKVRDISNNEGQMAESYYDYNPVKVGDLLLNPMDLYSGANCNVSLVEGVISPAYINLRHISDECPRFFDYYFKTQYWAMALFAHGKGISFDNRWTLGTDTLFNYYVPLPSPQEQKAIADFLDKKCAEIDKMIALQEKIIEELKAYKQSVITEAVTKGLNPDAPMKDSGVEWVGYIPEQWTVVRLKNIFLLKTGTTPNNFDKVQIDEPVNWYTPSDILDEGTLLEASARKLDATIIENEGIHLFPKHSIMFVGIGASAGKIGFTKTEGYSNQQITALIPQNCNSKYYYYFLTADRKRLRDNAFFTTLPIINNSYLSQDKVLFPPMEEQDNIAEFLDTKCSEIDSLVSIKLSKIDSLKEYKKSIIYEYVTGKKEVEA